MNDQKNTKFKKTKLLPGAIVFLGLVLYFNIRFENEMNMIDWAVILIGVIYLIIALLKDYRRNYYSNKRHASGELKVRQAL
jgi:uncharacterized membrane protein YesL